MYTHSGSDMKNYPATCKLIIPPTLVWVDFLLLLNLKKGHQRSVVPPSISVEKFIRAIDLYRKGDDFLGHVLYTHKGKKKFYYVG
jgi:hypothetical protein